MADFINRNRANAAPSGTQMRYLSTHQVYSAQVAAINVLENTTSNAYTNLGTVGPVVIVPVGGTGRVLVTVSALIRTSGTTNEGGNMSFSVTGVAPSDSRSVGISNPGTGIISMRASAIILLENLTPGLTTFTAKYRCTVGTGTGADFSSRTMVVEPLS